MKTTIFIVLFLMLSGCAQWRAVGEVEAAKTADTNLALAIYAACVAPTLGSLNRRFSNEEDLAEYIQHCRELRQ